LFQAKNAGWAIIFQLLAIFFNKHINIFNLVSLYIQKTNLPRWSGVSRKENEARMMHNGLENAANAALERDIRLFGV